MILINGSLFLKWISGLRAILTFAGSPCGFTYICKIMNEDIHSKTIFLPNKISSFKPKILIQKITYWYVAQYI